MSMTAFNRDQIKNVLNDRVVKAYEDRVLNTKDIYRNTLDPFSAVLDAKLLNKDIQSWVDDVEVPRQDQKTIQNAVGALHQEIIGTVDGWEDLGTGGVVDVKNNSKKIIAEIKNKHNTVNSDSALGVYDSLESVIKDRPGYTGYFAQILPKNGKSYDKEFTPSDKKTSTTRPFNPDIRVIDGKSFYALVTGEDDALEQLYNEFPVLVDEILEENFEDYSPVDLGNMRQDLFEKIFPKEDE